MADLPIMRIKWANNTMEKHLGFLIGLSRYASRIATRNLLKLQGHAQAEPDTLTKIRLKTALDQVYVRPSTSDALRLWTVFLEG